MVTQAAHGQYSSAGIDLREHRSAQHSYAIDEPPTSQATHQQLRQFSPSSQDIQAIKKGRLTEREYDDRGGRYYRETPVETGHGTDGVGQRGTSFIDRERSTESGSRETAHELITRVGINLGFVLALAVGGVLIYKQMQQKKSLTKGDHGQELRVCQTLALTTGASIYVVEGFGNKYLVAIDGGGIKSVEVLTTSFKQTLDESESYDDLEMEQAIASFSRGKRAREESPRSRRSRLREQQEQQRREREEPTSELDAKLINLLLQRTKQAA
ncbi:MAG: hypothetical protein AAFU85_19730 [Planctomycetota bacterium]